MNGSLDSVVPIIDLCALKAGKSNDPLLAAIDTACRNHGFFYVCNHGLEEMIPDVWRVTERFFELSHEEKRYISRTKANPMGYFDRELTKQKRDKKEIFDFGNEWAPEGGAGIVNQWPNSLDQFHPILHAYFEACTNLSKNLMGLVLKASRESDKYSDELFGPAHSSFMRLNYYPSYDPLSPTVREAATKLGSMALHRHTDAGALTVLLQDNVGGLQAEAADGWFDIEPIDGAVVINIGDMVQVLTNDRYKAAMHRVTPIRTGSKRYSIPYFFNPSPDAIIRPLPYSARNGRAYRDFSWNEFRTARAVGDYADYGVEVQISDFRICPTNNNAGLSD